MDVTKPTSGCCKPEIGRGCAFCDCGPEPEAVLAEGCFKLHETPWLEGYPDNIPTDIFEVRFKNTRRGFYRNANDLPLRRGDIVAVEASPGHDIGIVSLTGDLVAKQMRRTGFNPFNGEFKKIYRKAKPYDIERWQEAIALEHETMIQARQIAADMGLNMKIGDVEYQGDKIKAIFYYIADERVDFRELIKVFAERFHIRIEMKQIGARQEAGRIGGLGACGRELCCASWIASFTSVTTGAARVQDISLNPQKLAGQCSKLKCCMMYEYDTYVDARKDFPRLREPLQTVDGEYFLVKSDVLGGTMTFSTSKEAMANVVTLSVARVREIVALNRAGKKADRLVPDEAVRPEAEEPTFRSEEDSITRFDKEKAKRRKKTRGRGKDERDASGERPAESRSQEAQPAKTGDGQAKERDAKARERRPDGRRQNRRPEDGTKPAPPERSAQSATEGAPEGQVRRESGRRGGNRNRGRGNGNGNGNENGQRASTPPGQEAASQGGPRQGSSRRRGGRPESPAREEKNNGSREPRDGRKTE